MDYEKKYKEALERARVLMTNQNPPAFDKHLIEMVFPELQESEDERIRNFLIDFIKVCTWTEKKDQGWSSREDCLAWLEKQGEQKPTLPKWKYKKDHIPLLKDSLILNKYGCVGKSPSGAIVSDVWVLDYDELAKLPKEELEEQGEKKALEPSRLMHPYAKQYKVMSAYEIGFIEGAVWADSHPHWISVDEELPTKAEFYLCVIGDTIQVLFYNEGLEEWYEFYVTKEEHLDCEDWTKKVTHWMPLPQPPKEGGNNG